MKILHILDHSLPLYSGYTFRSQNILREQQKRGWNPIVVTSPKQEQSWKGFRLNKETINGITYYRTGNLTLPSIPFASELLLMKALARRIFEVAKAEKPDILHAHSPVLNAIPALWVGRKLGLPVVYEIRAFWEDAAVDHATYRENSWKYKLVRYLETRVCQKADQVGVISQGLKQDLINRGISEGKLSIIYNGINPEDFKSCEPHRPLKASWQLNGKKVVGFIGSFYHYEGLDLLVKAFSSLASKRSDILLLLVGGGDLENELREQIHSLGLEERVIMPGRIPHHQIPGVYALVDILAYPRYSMRLTELVTPLKPLEAMSMGKALVASDVGGHRELIRHNETGLLFSPGSPAELAQALETLLGDDDLRSRLGSQGHRWVREHRTWEKTTSIYKDIYGQLLYKQHSAKDRNQILTTEAQRTSRTNP